MRESKKNNTKHRFWDTQPVIIESKNSSDLKHGPIDDVKAVQDVPKTPLKIPSAFYWDEFDLSNSDDISAFANLLEHHYVEDDDHTFRFKYSKDFLIWALNPPGQNKDWLVCIRDAKTKEMLASITAIPATISINKECLRVAEINFLCIHKKLRSKRLAPVLIKEITRRVNLTNVWQAVYTAGTKISSPVTENLYFHRQLNPKKLVEIKFASKNPRLSLEDSCKLLSLPSTTDMPGLRELSEKDIESCHALLSAELKKYPLHPEFSLEEFRHWFLPRKDVIQTFVAYDEHSSKITDMLSFYKLCSTVLKVQHESLTAAYSFYNVATSVSLEKLFKNALIIAKNENYDVFNSLNLAENEKIFDNLKFKMGDGTLYYYVYNWKTNKVKPEENSLVMF